MHKVWIGPLEPLPPTASELGRRAVARGLLWLSERMSAWARAWSLPALETSPRTTVLEFHAEAGAPEGALFVDGQRIGTLSGVTRL